MKCGYVGTISKQKLNHHGGKIAAVTKENMSELIKCEGALDLFLWEGQ
jgi:hypothetical protein